MNKELNDIFTALKIYFNGEKNGGSARYVAYNFGFSERKMREFYAAINADQSIDGLISTNGSIYVCATEDECRKAIHNTYKTAFSYLKKARAMEKKCNLNGQYEFTDDNGKKIKIIYEDN